MTIAITERAAAGLQELLTTNNAPPGQGVKLVPGGTGQVGMIISKPGEGDAVVHREGAPLLIVESGIAGALDGAQIDCEISPAEGRPKLEFTLRPPER